MAVSNLTSSSPQPSQAATNGHSVQSGTAPDGAEFTGLLAMLLDHSTESESGASVNGALAATQEDQEDGEAHANTDASLSLGPPMQLPMMFFQATSPDVTRDTMAQKSAAQSDMPSTAVIDANAGKSGTQGMSVAAFLLKSASAGAALLNPLNMGEHEPGVANEHSQQAASETPASLPNVQPLFLGATPDVARFAQEPTHVKIHSPVGTSSWTNEVGSSLITLATNKVHSASLQLSPDHLGPVQVRIEVADSQASVWFNAAHADTRTALEQSLPQLRTLFASQGMTLMDAGVFNQQPQSHSGRSFEAQTAVGGMNDLNDDMTVATQVLRVGLLDTYA